MTTSEKDRAFIAELEQLTRKYGLAISGCGCCSSPYIIDLEEHETKEPYRYWHSYPEDQAALVWRAPHRPRPEPRPEVIPDTPAPITDADTAKDKAVYDAWKAKQP